MFVYGIVVIEILVCLTYGYPISTHHLPVNCSSYIDIVERDYICRRTNNESLFNLLDGAFMHDWTANDLREGLQTACSLTPTFSRTSYRECVQRLANACPSLPVAEALAERDRVFCKNGDISPLLNKALSVPITFDGSCVSDIQEMFNTSCMRTLLVNVRPLIIHGNLSTVMNVQQTDNFMVGFYECVKESMMSLTPPADPNQCHSTWQELTLGYVLSITGTTGLGAILPDSTLIEMTNDLILAYNVTTINNNNARNIQFW